MKVWVLEEYFPEDGFSDTLNVFEDADVGMHAVSKLNPGIIWVKYSVSNNSTYFMTNEVDSKKYYICEFEVILDEMPKVNYKGE